jgi:hypothetical protein
MELVYDFSQGGEADGWLHALMRYEDTKSGHNTETSFGSHIFNTALVYKNEPQSYAGRPPGLSTRLFLRLSNDSGTDALCHLIYPASTAWHAQSDTDLILLDAKGTEILKKTVHIPAAALCFGAITRCSAKKSVSVPVRMPILLYVTPHAGYSVITGLPKANGPSVWTTCSVFDLWH